jgi:hypothetical protein
MTVLEVNYYTVPKNLSCAIKCGLASSYILIREIHVTNNIADMQFYTLRNIHDMSVKTFDKFKSNKKTRLI